MAAAQTDQDCNIEAKLQPEAVSPSVRAGNPVFIVVPISKLHGPDEDLDGGWTEVLRGRNLLGLASAAGTR